MAIIWKLGLTIIEKFGTNSKRVEQTNSTLFYDIQVNTNGVLSFREQFTDFSQQSFETLTDVLVAVFWIDTDIVRSGDIYYRLVTTNSSSVDQTNAFIRDLFELELFTARYLFVATYDQVAAFGGGSGDNRVSVKHSQLHAA